MDPRRGKTRMSDEAFLRIAKALADPTRLSILERIAAEKDVLCADMAGAFPIAQATMSHHLKELREAGLIGTEKEGKCIRLRLVAGALEAYRSELSRRIPGA
jgi:ArsR family transcriptional regulator